MRYLSLAEALIIAEAVTGIDARTLSRASRLELLDSALHAPQAGFGDDDFYPDFTTKAAVLVVRLARNHPLPDGNKRLAWHDVLHAQLIRPHGGHGYCRDRHAGDRRRGVGRGEDRSVAAGTRSALDTS